MVTLTYNYGISEHGIELAGLISNGFIIEDDEIEGKVRLTENKEYSHVTITILNKDVEDVMLTLKELAVKLINNIQQVVFDDIDSMSVHKDYYSIFCANAYLTVLRDIQDAYTRNME